MMRGWINRYEADNNAQTVACYDKCGHKDDTSRRLLFGSHPGEEDC